MRPSPDRRPDSPGNQSDGRTSRRTFRFGVCPACRSADSASHKGNLAEMSGVTWMCPSERALSASSNGPQRDPISVISSMTIGANGGPGLPGHGRLEHNRPPRSDQPASGRQPARRAGTVDDQIGRPIGSHFIQQGCVEAHFVEQGQLLVDACRSASLDSHDEPIPAHTDCPAARLPARSSGRIGLSPVGSRSRSRQQPVR